MPERAEIAIMSDCLGAKLTGKKCNYVIIFEKYNEAYNRGLYSSSNIFYNQGQSYKYVQIGVNLDKMSSRGKKIIFEFNGFRFVSSCGMTGKWSWQKNNNTMIALLFDDITAYYEHTVMGGNFSICNYPSPEYEHIFKEVGPDLMTDEVDFNIYYSIIKRKRIQHMEICLFMMEQKYMSGIGNYLRSEILYRAMINPHRTLSSLSDQDIYNLFYFSKMIIMETYRSNGLTIQDYLDPNGNIGSYQCQCYKRETDNYGNRIITEYDKGNGKGRVIHWCPEIQK